MADVSTTVDDQEVEEKVEEKETSDQNTEMATIQAQLQKVQDELKEAREKERIALEKATSTQQSPDEIVKLVQEKLAAEQAAKAKSKEELDNALNKIPEQYREHVSSQLNFDKPQESMLFLTSVAGMYENLGKQEVDSASRMYQPRVTIDSGDKFTAVFESYAKNRVSHLIPDSARETKLGDQKYDVHSIREIYSQSGLGHMTNEDIFMDLSLIHI